MAWQALSVFFLGKETLWNLEFAGIQITFSHFRITERQCSTFQKPKGVTISPATCGRQPAKPGTICQLSCRQGFILSGVREEMRCTTSGKWSTKVQTAVCKGRSCTLVRLQIKFPCNDCWYISGLSPLATFVATRDKLVGVAPIYSMRISFSKW